MSQNTITIIALVSAFANPVILYIFGYNRGYRAGYNAAIKNIRPKYNHDK